jgi:hypothetical protein
VEYNGKICEVIGTLDTFGLNLSDGEGNIYCDIYCGDVNPIPVTDKILEKIGYAYDSVFAESWTYRVKSSFTSDYYPKTQKFTFHSKQFDCILPNTEYVHQMQHCLEIAEKEFLILREHLITNKPKED